MKRLILLFALALGACGPGASPELSNLRASSRRAQIGTEIFLRADVFDSDGDLQGGQLLARIKGIDVKRHLECRAIIARGIVLRRRNWNDVDP